MWIFYSISAAFLWSCTNILDKTIVTKYVRKPIVPVMIMGLVSFLLGLGFLFFNFTWLPNWFLFWNIIAGVAYLLCVYFYFISLKREETSRVIPLFALSLVFVLFLSAIFLEEILTWQKYLGVLIIALGSALISLRRGFSIFKNKALGLMIFSNLFYAVSLVIDRYLLLQYDFWTIFAYKNLGIFIGAIPFLIYYFPALKENMQEFGYKAIALVSFSETMKLIALFIFLIATSLAYVALTEALASTQYLFVFIWSVVLSVWFPKIIKEEIKGKIIIFKLAAIVIIVAGVFLITV